ncbi:metallo-beta-lactamase family protein [Saccharothrix ecbatanensis]|uniref:Metallo-beta-lactamase family protein n=1 Tax=Saccharothrix ecbatanensis TaxID=1105145 RepID=A0A7W9LYU1_9PSEU|nr:MBL fold metallo-hydrolase [Saccharothrix ecbatanensis]MBB5801209.1 metallo-beta-lactamase family protein [Saccharothrix ecbatanensis]
MAKRAAEPTSLTFLGATGTVTGSKFLFDTGSSGVLVDCGLFQGLAPLRRRNWQPPRLELDRLDAVVLTHAHLDHCGYLPVLVRNGWCGPVYTTEGTADLAAIVLADSAHLMVEDARQANEGGWTKHKPALPLYDTDDAAAAIRLFHRVDHGTSLRIAHGVDLELGRAGHILGSSWAHLDFEGRTAVVSGDLGRQHHRVLLPPQPRPECDALLVESTYGDRAHDDERATALLADTIRRTAARGGSVLIPAFAVDRTEVVLIELAKLTRAGAIPDLPVFVDSPMALASLRVYRQAVAKSWPEVRPELLHTLEDPFDPGRLAELHTATQSMEVNNPHQPSIVISASGMATGGRVLHHLKQMLPDPRHTVLVVGYAAAGTRARQLATGAREIKIHGRYVPVKAEVQVLDAFSAHADADELLAWAAGGPEPGTTYLVHGEPESSAILAARLATEHGWNAVVPRDGERVLI